MILRNRGCLIDDQTQLRSEIAIQLEEIENVSRVDFFLSRTILIGFHPGIESLVGLVLDLDTD